jgi:hypothetical protein
LVGGRIDDMADVVVKFVGVNAMIQSLQQLEPDTYKQLRKDIRFITAPAVSAVKKNVPTISPFAGGKDGFTHTGRTAWSGASVTTNITPAQRSRAYGSTTSNLVAISATGQNKQFGFNILDMAGRGTGRGRNPKTQTKVYAYKGGSRSHRLNGQGQGMIDALNKRPSRYFYPAIEDKLPEIRRRVEAVIDKVAADMNRKIGKM